MNATTSESESDCVRRKNDKRRPAPEKDVLVAQPRVRTDRQFILMYSSLLLFSRGSSTAHFVMLRLEAESDSDSAAQSRWYVTRRIR
jgi:hypothetical protein